MSRSYVNQLSNLGNQSSRKDRGTKKHWPAPRRDHQHQHPRLWWRKQLRLVNSSLRCDASAIRGITKTRDSKVKTREERINNTKTRAGGWAYGSQPGEQCERCVGRISTRRCLTVGLTVASPFTGSKGEETTNSFAVIESGRSKRKNTSNVGTWVSRKTVAGKSESVRMFSGMGHRGFRTKPDGQKILLPHLPRKHKQKPTSWKSFWVCLL